MKAARHTAHRPATRSRTALALLCAMTFVAVAACGDDDDGSQGGSQTTASSGGATTSAGGGTSPSTEGGGAPSDADTEASLRIYFTAPPTTMDPHKATGVVFSHAYHFPVFDRLLMVDTSLEVQPMLATDWEFGPDGRTLDLDLRTDVQFHSGRPVDAAAVKASLERAKTLEGSTQAGALSSVTSIDVVSPSRVRLNLSGGNAALLATLTTGAGVVMDPEVFNDPAVDMATNPSMAGSGPWVVTAFVPNQSATYERAPGTYWDDRAGLLKNVHIEFTSDQAARINAIRSGAADMVFINIGQSGNVTDLTSGDRYVLHKIPGPTEVVLWFNDQRNEFANVKVRQAIKQAIDPEPIAEGLLNGDCVAEPGIYPPDAWAHDSIEDPFPYDPDAARQALAESGVDDLSFTAITNAGSASNDVAVVVQAQLAEVGIEMNVQPGQTAANTQLYTSRDYEAFINPISQTNDPDGVLSNQIVDGYRVAGAAADRLRPLKEQALNPSLSQDERRELYTQISQEIMDDVLLVPICFASTLWLTEGDVQGVEDIVWTGILDFRSLYVEG